MLESLVLVKIENFICMGLFSPGSVDSLKLLFLALVEKIVWVVLLGICGFVGISRSRKSQKLRKFHMLVSGSWLVWIVDILDSVDCG